MDRVDLAYIIQMVFYCQFLCHNLLFVIPTPVVTSVAAGHSVLPPGPPDAGPPWRVLKLVNLGCTGDNGPLIKGKTLAL